MFDDHSWMPVPPAGPGRLKKMLEMLEEDKEKLTKHPLYKEGYEDGYNAAQENHRLLMQALSKVYNINE